MAMEDAQSNLVNYTKRALKPYETEVEETEENGITE